MIGLNERRKLYFTGNILELPILEGEFEGDLHRSSAGVRIKRPGETRRGKLDQLFGQENGRNIGQAEKGRVRELRELACDRGVDLWVVMAMQVAPEGGHPIQIL